MGYNAEYSGFFSAATASPLDVMPRLTLADNCDDDPSQAGGAIGSKFGQTPRSALIRVQVELAKMPRDEKLLELQRDLIRDSRPLLLNEISQVDGWQTMIAPGVGRVESITDEQLARIFDNGMIGHAQFDRHVPGQFARAAECIPLTRMTLNARTMSYDHQSHDHWLTAERVREIPNTLNTLKVDGAMPDRAAQDALFKHPLMEHLQHLSLTIPESGRQEHVSIDLGLGSPVMRSPNPNYDPSVQLLDEGLAQRLTSGKLGKDLKTLHLEYQDVQNSGVRALLASDKLHNTVIELNPPHERNPARINAWAQQLDRQTWLDLAGHNKKAVQAQGGTYELPDHVRETLNANRSTLDYIRRRRIDSADDLPAH